MPRNTPKKRSPNCTISVGWWKRSIHTTTKDTPFHKEVVRAIIAVSALLELARWSRQRKECYSGGEPCPKARKTEATESPPAPTANRCSPRLDESVARIAHPKPPEVASEVESAGESTTKRGGTRGGEQ